MWTLLLPILSLAAFSNAELKGDYEKINNYILRNGTRYYAVISTLNRTDALGLFYGEAIGDYHGYIMVIDTENEPTWVKKNSYQDPDLNVIEVDNKDTVRLYFAAKNKKTKKLDISVVYYPTLFSFDLYNTVNYQLVYNDTYDNWSPSLTKFDDDLLLTYHHNERQDITDIGIQYLDSTGMDVANPPKSRGNKAAVRPDQWWEGKHLKNQWSFLRGKYLYIVYETEIDGFVGVARSSNPLGSFEKISTPLFVREKAHVTREHLQKNLAWNEDDWPYIKA